VPQHGCAHNDLQHHADQNMMPALKYAIGRACCCLMRQDEGWRPSITVKQIMMGIQVRLMVC